MYMSYLRKWAEYVESSECWRVVEEERSRSCMDKLIHANPNEKTLLTFCIQANETFAFVGNVTHYTRVWLNISAQLRTFLEEGRLHNHLVWLQQVDLYTSHIFKCLMTHYFM